MYSAASNGSPATEIVCCGFHSTFLHSWYTTFYGNYWKSQGQYDKYCDDQQKA